MKKISTLVLFAFFAFANSYGQDATVKSTKTEKVSGPVLTLDEIIHDFGPITEGTQATYIFKFKNTGNQPLIISDISTPCGCTTPVYTHDPIMPGKKGEITVNFNSTGKSGEFNKVLVITTNIPNATPSTITIKGTVNPKQ